MFTRLFSPLAVAISALPALTFSDDVKLIQGTWAPIKAEFSGKPWPPAMLSTMQLTIEGDQYEFVEGPTRDIGKTVIRPGHKPKAMDIIGVKGPNAGKTIPAIYKVEPGKFSVCYGIDGRRPTEFVSPVKKMVLLVVYWHKKVAKP